MNISFFPQPSEVRSGCKTNFASFDGIRLKKSKKDKNTSFVSKSRPEPRVKIVNQELERAKRNARERREKAVAAGKNYGILLENPTAKVQKKGDTRFINLRGEKGKFAGKIVLF